MRIAIMGAGAIGGYFGALLAAVGQEVVFIARGPHLAAMRANGLTVLSERGDVTVDPVWAIDDPSEVGPVDWVVVTVKNFDLIDAAERMAPMVGPDTAIVSFQNGVESAEILAGRFGRDRVLDGITYLPAVVAEPGVIRHTGPVNRFVFGELDGAETARAIALRDAGEAAGIDMALRADIEVEVWRKFLVQSTFAALCCLGRYALGTMLSRPAVRAVYRQGMDEVFAVARAKGVALPDDEVEKALHFAETVADPATSSSMLTDLERGNRIEIESLSGAVVRLGREFGVPTPFHDMALAVLSPYADSDGRPG